MMISVVLCTYNRASTLPLVLDSLAASILPESVDWEVLVVDNNSPDQTRQVVEEYCLRYPGRFRYVFEPLQGLSNARNSGIRASQGDIIAFTDDDVRLEPDWLHNLTGALHEGTWAGAGGRILPQWTCPPPAWLPLSGSYSWLLGILPVFDDGIEPEKLSRPPFGANMAFRREAFERFGGFRPDLGRTGKNIMSNEDTEFGRRLMAAGEQLRYEPSAVVYHPVAENRLTKKYYLGWWFNFGRAEAREAIARPFPALLRLATVNLGYRSLRWAVARHRHKRFVRKIRVWKTVGQIFELCCLALQRDLPAGKDTNYPAIQSRSQKPAHAE